jgi:CheY-like chemotaxis protein
MVHGLAAQLGGMLELDSAPGKGTTARIWLPVTDETAKATRTDQELLQSAVRRATILLVDDEDLVRNGTADMLRDIGYDVICAGSGSEALSILRSGGDIDLVITDYLMPGLDGVELAHEVRDAAPHIPVLLITGYSTIASGRGALLPRLAKPFRQVELAARVSDLLTSASSADVVQLRPKAHAP